MSQEHTILLLQFNANDAHSRTYLDFDTVQDALDALVQMHENKLRQAKKSQGDDFDAGGDLDYDWRSLV